MKKVILILIISLIYFSACNLDFNFDDEKEPRVPVMVSPKPQIVFDASGNAMAVWHQNDGIRDNIWSNRFSSVSGWETAQPVMENFFGTSINPRIAMNDSGKAAIVWEQQNNMTVKMTIDTTSDIWSSIWSDTSGWGEAQLIEEGEKGDAKFPDISIDSSGEAIAVWSLSDGKNFELYYNIYSGSEWEGPELIESNDDDNLMANVEYLSPGNAIAVWHKSDDTGESIFSNIYSSETGWGTKENIGIDNVDRIYESQIIMDHSGSMSAMVVWGMYDNGVWEIYHNSLFSGTTWGEALPISDAASAGEFDPQVAFDGNGNAIAVWRNYDGNDYSINSCRYNKNTGWESKVETISDKRSVLAYDPQIISDSSGEAIVVWYQNNEGKWQICSNRYVPDSEWQGVEVIGSDEFKDSKYPSIASDLSGNVIVVWNQNNESIWARRFDGTAWESAIQISQDVILDE